jgi:transposase
VDAKILKTLRRKFAALKPTLDERSLRIYASTEAESLGRGGIAAVARVFGLARSTIGRGLKEVRGDVASAPQGRIRRPGGGRKRLVDTDPRLMKDLESLVEPGTRGDPESPLLWTSKSLRQLATQLQKMGHSISYRTVGTLLERAGYSLQANRKTREGHGHADRDAQFEHIHQSVLRHQRGDQPVISVDTKKKELIGDFKNGGREWRPKGKPRRVRVHDFLLPEKGKAIPYGVYDLTRNEGWVSIGIDHDTATFAVQSIRRWWRTMGRRAYPGATSLLITADAGGSNGSRTRLWKWELQRFADETGLQVSVCHFPPGTSKWNKIEHRLFSFISRNWRGRPLESLAVIVSLIGSTRTSTGLHVRCEIDPGRYPKGQEVTDEQMATIRLKADRFHGDWNYTLAPRSRAPSSPPFAQRT